MAVVEAPPLAEVPPVVDGVTGADAAVEKPKGRGRRAPVQLSIDGVVLKTHKVAVTGMIEVTDAMAEKIIEGGWTNDMRVQLVVSGEVVTRRQSKKRDAEGDRYAEGQLTVHVTEASKVTLVDPAEEDGES